MRGNRAFINSGISLIYELINIICSFIVPRLILYNFGSNYNGLTSAILQFLNCIILLRAGISAVTRFALYKPLNEKDNKKISEVIYSTNVFMKKVSVIFLFILFIYGVIYPFFVIEDFKWTFTFTLILIMGLSTVIQNYYGVTYQMLLIADQKKYIYSIIQIIVLILNTLFTVILIKLGSTIHGVKLATTIICIINPILLILYVKKNYKLDSKVNINLDLISQRWDAFTQEVAMFVNNNTDLVILTIFTNVFEISVYTIYYMVANGVRTLIISITAGFGAALGNMIAKKENDILNKNFGVYEFILYTVSVIAFTVTAILIVPFIKLYTHGINDANYIRPVFGVMISLCHFFYCIRIPYHDLIEGVGHFKQTKLGAIIEAVLNITISIVLVKKLGLIGVTFGTLAAMIFRTIQYSVYSSKNILKRSITIVIKRIFISFLEVLTILIVYNILPRNHITNYFEWIIAAIILILICIFVTSIYSILFYKNDFVFAYNKIAIIIKNINNKSKKEKNILLKNK